MRKYRQKFSIQSSQERLEKLIEARLEPSANIKEVDNRIWDLFGEHWCVMFTDLSGFSRNVAEFGIIHFLQVIYESDRLFLPIIDDHEGIFLKRDGDSLLVIFRNPNKAIDCAIKMQKETVLYNQEHTREEDILLCIGLGCGDMLRVDQDIFGKEVNFAAKLGEDIAQAGEILATEAMVANSALGYEFVELEKKIVGIGSIFKLNYK